MPTEHRAYPGISIQNTDGNHPKTRAIWQRKKEPGGERAFLLADTFEPPLLVVWLQHVGDRNHIPVISAPHSRPVAERPASVAVSAIFFHMLGGRDQGVRYRGASRHFVNMGHRDHVVMSRVPDGQVASPLLL